MRIININQFLGIAINSVVLLAADAVQASSTINFPLEAVVAATCVVEKESNLSVYAIDLEVRTPQTLGFITYRCNNPDGFTRTISSAEGGVLKRVGGSEVVPYQIKHSGADLSIWTPRSLASPYTSSHAMSPDYVRGRQGGMSVQVPVLPANLYAGSYTDTITITIVGN